MPQSLWPHGLQHARSLHPPYLLEFVWIPVLWVTDVNQPSHPLLPLSSFAFNLSPQQSLFQWVNFSHQKAKVFEVQHQFFQWVFRVNFLEVQFSSSVMSNSLWHHGLQHTRLPCPSSTPIACSNLCLSSWWCHPTISSSVIPFYSCFHLSQHQGLFQRVSSLHQVAKVLEFKLQHQSFQWIFRTEIL